MGHSKRTNEQSIHQLSRWFTGIPVHFIPVSGTLHLKCIVTLVDQNTLVVAETELGKELMSYISNNCNNVYTFVVVPDVPASNLLRIGNTIVIQDGFPKSQLIIREFAERHHLNLITLQMSELIKADGSLTCGSILFKI